MRSWISRLISHIKSEIGAMVMSSMIIGIVMIVVALLMFPIVLDAVAGILSWTSGGSSITTFTGLQALIKVSPLLVFIGLLAGGGWLTFKGFGGGEGFGGGKRGRGLH